MIELFSILTTIFWFLVIITIIVFIHEMGHLLIARLFGVKVEEFSLGFGKELAHYKCKQKTKWKLSAIPLGGYVRFFGDATVFSSEDREKLSKMTKAQKREAFAFKPIWQKFLIVLGGPFANYLTAFLIFTYIFVSFGRAEITPEVTNVIEGSPAEAAGIEIGDLITHANGEEIETMKDLSLFIIMNQEKPIEFTIKRDEDESFELEITPKMEEVTYGGVTEETPRIGIAAEKLTIRKLSLIDSVKEGVLECYNLSVNILKFLKQMIMGERSVKQLGGPITIAKYSSHSANLGFYAVLMFIALISVNIGLLNLLPIPIVDGGHLLHYIIQMVTGRELPEKVQRSAYVAGGMFLMLLMGFVIINDIIKFL